MSEQKLYQLKNKTGTKMDMNYVVNRNQVLKNFKTLISYRDSSDSVKNKYYKLKYSIHLY